MKIRNLAIYPVKSCGGIELDSALLTKSGLSSNGYRDHQYMVVDGEPKNGSYNFLTQRDPRTIKQEGSDRISQMALIRPIIVNDSLRLTWGYAEAIDIPDDGKDIPVSVWDDKVLAVDKGKDIAEWLSDHLGIKARLVEAAGYFSRLSGQDYVENDSPVRFQDAYPIHWFSIESVDELSEKAGIEIPWKSFRPQIVVEGANPSFEHDVEFGEFGTVGFRNVSPCYRCAVTLVDQETGLVREHEPLRTLATYKNWKNREGKRKVIFGENALPQSMGKISIGDGVSIISMKVPVVIYGSMEQVA